MKKESKEKPIIATTLSGLFLKSEPWDRAHVLWFQEAAKKLNDNSVLNWIDRSDYFKGVDEVMRRLYPKLNDEKRTIKARELFFDSVCKYIKQNPDVKNEEIISYFNSLKPKFRIALITTNTKKAVNKILLILKMSSFFNIIEASKVNEKDDKKIVFERFIKKYGKPVVYIGGGRKDSYDYCAEHKINRIFANFEMYEEIKDVKSVHNLFELKKAVSKII